MQTDNTFGNDMMRQRIVVVQKNKEAPILSLTLNQKTVHKSLPRPRSCTQFAAVSDP